MAQKNAQIYKQTRLAGLADKETREKEIAEYLLNSKKKKKQQRTMKGSASAPVL